MTSMIRRDKGDTLYLLVHFSLKPRVACASLPSSLLLFSRFSGSAATTEPTLACVAFLFSEAFPVPYIASTTLVGILALLRLFPALPDPVPRLPSLSSINGPHHDATAFRFPARLRPRPCFHLAFVRSPSLPSPFPFPSTPPLRKPLVMIRRDKGHKHTLSTCTAYLSPERLVLPSLLRFYSILEIFSRSSRDLLGPDLLNQLSVYCLPFFFSFALLTVYPIFPHRVSCACVVCCVCVCVCVFIKLHITTQSGPVILVILCHSH